VKLAGLVRCPGPHARGCGDGALVEEGRICSPCQTAERRQEARSNRAEVGSLPRHVAQLADSAERDPKGSRQVAPAWRLPARTSPSHSNYARVSNTTSEVADVERPAGRDLQPQRGATYWTSEALEAPEDPKAAA
jgi:hypothetical protein